MAEKIQGVSIIMPTLNEAGNIADLIRSAVAAVASAGIPCIEILVVDDDSPDRTWEVAGTVKCPGATVRVIRRLSGHGLTNSLRDGITAASQEVVVWMDCDFSHPPERIPQMLFMLEQGYDIAVNSRYTIGGGEVREGKGGLLQLGLSRLLNWTVRFLLYPSFSDYTSGFVAARCPVLAAVPLRGDYGEYFADFIFRALRARYRVCELPYWADPRRSGESKTGSTFGQYWRRGRKYLWTVVRLRLEALRGAI
ncbi:MAG TPA: glycosyltransferase [Anaerolineales bacterium]|nr:glycosyltransferase [Anaerolineales bacterium]